jgi:calcineurin-like phosphoesterase family protein
MNVWVISDTHFTQESVLKFIDSYTGKYIRPGFANTHEHDEFLIDKWNSTIAPDDVVYHLGDVCHIPEQEHYRDNIHSRLNGKKRLIVGNHDDIRFQSTLDWTHIDFWVDLYNDNVLLSHTPQEAFALNRGHPGKRFLEHEPRQRLNVHGHIHQNPVAGENYRCVSVEQTDFAPVNLDIFIKEALWYQT